MNPERLSFEEASRELGVSEEELEQLVAAGEIASIKEGDTLYFKKEVVRKYKKSQDKSTDILLTDDEIDLLDDGAEMEIEYIGAGDKEAGGSGPARGGAKSEETDSVPLEDDLLDIDLVSSDEETSGVEEGTPAGARAEKKGDIADDETILNLDGILEEESEGTTPVLAGVDDDSTLLDTDLLDLGDGSDPFASDTVAEAGATDLTEPGTLLRGGGARVMQMKRKQSHAAWTAVLAFAALLLLLPLGILTNLLFAHSPDSEEKGLPSEESYTWITDFNVLDGAVEGLADLLKGS